MFGNTVCPKFLLGISRIKNAGMKWIVKKKLNVLRAQPTVWKS